MEQIINQVCGFGFAWGINIFLLPALGMPGGASKAFGVTFLFMSISIVRGYFVRRLFNWWHVRKPVASLEHAGGITETANRVVLGVLDELRPELCAAAQGVYDDWQQDQDGMDEEYGTGGICDRISEAMSDVLVGAGFDVDEGGQQGDDHAYLIASACGFDFIVDIPPRVYERGGGYVWTKRPGVVFAPNDVFISRNDTE